MSQELEIEFKNLLTKDEYQKLFDALNFDQVDPLVQENYYFDTPDMAIKAVKSALRIRLKEGQAEMTLKTPKDGHLLETNIDLSPEKAKELISQESFTPDQSILDQLAKEGCQVDQVNLVTDLKTKRYELPYKEALLVLDQSWYGDTSDYELELEAPDHDFGINLFNQVLKDYGIVKKDTPNKIQRAYQNLDK